MVRTIIKIEPELRFPEFTGEWKKKQLGHIATFSKGKNISKSDIIDEGKHECIRYGELYTTYGEVIEEIYSKTDLPKKELVFSEENDVIIPSSGETQLDIATASCVLKKEIALGGDLNIIKSDNNGVFLAYYLNSHKKYRIASLSQGISVVHLYAHHLKGLKLNLPSLEEQNKVASFLASVDKKLQQLTKKKKLLEHYKKGALQQIFSQELRFKGDDGKAYPNWEEKYLGDVCKVLIGGTPDTTNVKYWNGKIKWIGSSELKNNIISKPTKTITEQGLKNSSTVLMPVNTTVLAMTGATLGKIGYLEIECCGNQSVAGFIDLKNINSKYLFYQLQKITNQIYSFAGGAAQSGINKSNIEKLKIQQPIHEEQTKIADFLTAIDTKINQVSDQIEQTKSFKKGLLQKLFI